MAWGGGCRRRGCFLTIFVMGDGEKVSIFIPIHGGTVTVMGERMEEDVRTSKERTAVHTNVHTHTHTHTHTHSPSPQCPRGYSSIRNGKERPMMQHRCTTGSLCSHCAKYKTTGSLSANVYHLSVQNFCT